MAWNGYSEKGQGSEERGPSTFAFAPPATPQAEASRVVMAKAGYETAQSVGGLNEYSDKGTDATADAVFKFAAATLKPYADKLAAEKFLEGQQRAASGEALTEIVESQPWYSRIFGPSSAVEGARQYTLDAKSAEFDAEVQRRMPELKEMPPDKLPGVILELGKSFQTGDPQVDAAMGMRLTKVLPNLIKLQTREFYKHQQEQAFKARFNAWQNLGTSLQVTSTNPMATEDDKLLRQEQMLSALVRPYGVDSDSHLASVGTFMATLAENGQFAALKTVQGSGVMNELPPDKRLQLEKQITAFKKQHARGAADDYAEQLTTIQAKAANNEYAGGKEVFEAFNAINADYTARTGNDEPVVHRAMMGSTALTARQAYLAYTKEQAEAAAKVKEGQARAGMVEPMLLTTTYNKAADAMKAAGGKAADVEDAARGVWLKLGGDPKKQAAWLLSVSADGGAIPSIKDDIQGMLGRIQDSKDQNFINGYRLYKEFLTQHPGDPASNKALTAYMSDREIARFSAFDQALGGQPVEVAGERAFALSRNVIVNPGHTFTKDEDRGFDKWVDGDGIRGNKLWAGVQVTNAGNEPGYLDAPPPLTPTSKLVLKSMMQASWKAAQALDPNNPYQAAYTLATRNGLEVFGSYSWVNGAGRDSIESKLTYASGMPFTKPMIANGLNNYMDTRIKAITDKKPDTVFLHRGADLKDGTPTFVFSVTVGGETKPEVMFTGKDLSAHIQQMAGSAARAKAMDTGPIDAGYHGYDSFKPSNGYAKPTQEEIDNAAKLRSGISDAATRMRTRNAKPPPPKSTTGVGPDLTFPK